MWYILSHDKIIHECVCVCATLSVNNDMRNNRGGCPVFSQKAKNQEPSPTTPFTTIIPIIIIIIIIIIMKLGFSLSPGGLLLPYHWGALDCLDYEKILTRKSADHDQGSTTTCGTPIAGSSAGAIAAMAHGCGLSKRRVLEATIQVSDEAAALGGARGRLLPLLQNQMNRLVGDEEWEYLLQQQQQQQQLYQSSSSCLEPGITTTSSSLSCTSIGIAYKEIFPRQRSILQTSFASRQDLFQAVSASCMFPFFATNFPCLCWDHRSSGDSLFGSRLVVDGFFSVPRERFGCPDFELAVLLDPMDRSTTATTTTDAPTTGNDVQMENKCPISSANHPMRVDRTIAISVFPKSKIGMTAFEEEDTISPTTGEDWSMEDLFRIATQASSRHDLTNVFELGYRNAEDWCRKEQRQRRMEAQEALQDSRKLF